VTEDLSLQALSGRAGGCLKQAGLGRAGDDLGEAWRKLQAAGVGRTMIERHAAGDGRLVEVLGVPWETLEDAAMCVSFGAVLTALDLCADAVLLVCGAKLVNPDAPKTAPGSFYSLADLRKLNGTPSVKVWVEGKPIVPPAMRAWVNQLNSHPDLATVHDWRHAVLHRQVRRHPMVAFPDGGPIRSAPSAVTVLDSQGPVEGRIGKDIGEEVVRVVEFGEGQLEDLCRAILAAPPPPPRSAGGGVTRSVRGRRGKTSHPRPA
jgi:hypothetical protein